MVRCCAGPAVPGVAPSTEFLTLAQRPSGEFCSHVVPFGGHGPQIGQRCSKDVVGKPVNFVDDRLVGHDCLPRWVTGHSCQAELCSGVAVLSLVGCSDISTQRPYSEWPLRAAWMRWLPCRRRQEWVPHQAYSWSSEGPCAPASVTLSRDCASLVQTTAACPALVPQNSVPATLVGAALRRHAPGVHSPFRQLSTNLVGRGAIASICSPRGEPRSATF